MGFEIASNKGGGNDKNGLKQFLSFKNPFKAIFTAMAYDNTYHVRRSIWNLPFRSYLCLMNWEMFGISQSTLNLSIIESILLIRKS